MKHVHSNQFTLYYHNDPPLSLEDEVFSPITDGLGYTHEFLGEASVIAILRESSGTIDMSSAVTVMHWYEITF